jgi:phosphoglucosamine mutase
VVDGDRVMGMAAIDLDSREGLNHRTLVATVMSNRGLENGLRRRGIQMIRTPVGDRYVVEEMRRGGFNLGGEQSGHVVFLDYNTTGDGIISALQVFSLMRRKEQTLAELAAIVEPLPQVIVNVVVPAKPPLDEIQELNRGIRAAEARLGEEGRVLVRYSGTEAVLRIMVEGEDPETINQIATELEDIVANRIR